MDEKRSSLKLHHPRFNNYPFWKDKLRENCFKRVREDRSRLLWKLRLPDAQPLNDQEFIKTAFQDIVSDELKRIKNDHIDISTTAGTKADDFLWEYNGLQDAYQGDCEAMLLEMQRIFYEDLSSQSSGKEPENHLEAWEDQEDEYLALAVFEHMQLNDQLVLKQVWCPICKKGALLENERLIFCPLCKLELNKENEVNLEFLRDRLAEAHEDHFERGCKMKPEFSVEAEFGLTALYIRCQACNTFEVVV